ncbi:secreted protein [Melampsora americana]|nr:secreted protein [Melampsora americana]
MKIVHLICMLAFHTYFTFAALTYKLERVSKPTPDQFSAYVAIEHAMSAAVKRYNKFVVVDIKAWPLATIEVRKLFNNPKLEIGCDNRHFWPGGLNWSKEFSPINADNHCKIIQAMRKDGMK